MTKANHAETHTNSIIESSLEGFDGRFYPLPSDMSGFFFKRNSTDLSDAKLYAELRDGSRVIIACLKHNSCAEKALKILTDKYACVREAIEAEKQQREEQRQDLNHYERRIEERRDRYENMALKKRREAHNAFDTSHNTLAHLPFGQPILVGHHSENRHRALIKRSHNQMDKACQLDKTADYYENRAERIGTGGISSDDPDAINKLELKLENLQKSHAMMIAGNKVLRKKSLSDEDKIEQLFCLGFSENLAKEVVNAIYGETGFPKYRLSNSNANIKATEKRINQLKNVKKIDAETKTYKGFEFEIDTEDNRILFRFDSRPNQDVCSLMRRHAFKFSPTRKNAWIRQITPNALRAARYLTEELQKLL